MSRRTRVVLLAAAAFVAVVAALQLFLLDGVQGLVLGAVLREDTVYGAGYSDERFRGIRVGMTSEEVRRILGGPLGESWAYDPNRRQGCQVIDFAGDLVKGFNYSDTCVERGLRKGMTKSDVIARIGSPQTVFWSFSRSARDTHYRIRVIKFTDGRVTAVSSKLYLD